MTETGFNMRGCDDDDDDVLNGVAYMTVRTVSRMKYMQVGINIYLACSNIKHVQSGQRIKLKKMKIYSQKVKIYTIQ